MKKTIFHIWKYFIVFASIFFFSLSHTHINTLSSHSSVSRLFENVYYCIFCYEPFIESLYIAMEKREGVCFIHAGGIDIHRQSFFFYTKNYLRTLHTNTKLYIHNKPHIMTMVSPYGYQ